VLAGFAAELTQATDCHRRTELDPRLVWLVLALATAAAAALRLPFLGHQSLWLDETLTRDILGAPSLSGVWDHVKATESTPPLYYVIGWLLGGRSAVAMRAIPAVALIASVPISFLSARGFVGERAALATASIMAVSPVLVSYSTDARAYGLFVLCALLSVWAFSAVLAADSPGAYLLWSVASIACMWTHYFGVFVIAGEAAVLLAIRPQSRRATIVWTALIVVCVLPLIPLVASQAGDERAAFIAGMSLGSRVTTTVRQFALGPNVPRTWLEVAGLVLWCPAVAIAVVRALRSDDGPRVLLALAVAAVGIPLLAAVVKVEDRFYVRNVIAAAPLAAAMAAGPMLRLRSVPLVLYVALATVTSLWVATNWRYEQTDWRDALARVEAIDPKAPVLAVTASSAPVVRTYLDRAAAPPGGIVTRRAWIVVEPVRMAHDRGLVPAPVPTTPGFAVRRSLQAHAFGLELLTAATPTRLPPLNGATLFPGR
jgi:4-amino-4-deoxy-L-arabinose transferase-like glycosyltransferase